MISFLKRFLIVFYCAILSMSLKLYAQTNIERNIDTIKVELEQVTVTATRYPENIIEIPYAVSIIPKTQFQNIKGYGLDEALSFVPGILAQSRAGNQDIRLVIRGFGARGSGDRSNSGTSRGIRIMLDGIPETEPDGRTSFDHIDLTLAENIEVIRSNSSALWGNASGGIVNISTIGELNEPFLDYGSTIGSFGFQKYFLRAGTIIGSTKFKLGIANTTFEGWRVRSGSKRTVANLSIESMLAQKTKLGVFLVGTGNLFHIPGPLTKAQFDADPKQSNTTYLARDERRYNRLGRIAVSLEHEINSVHSLSGMAYANPKYLQRSERGTFRDFTRYHIGGNLLYRNNLQFSNNISNKFTVGIDEAYQDGAVLFYSLSATNGRGSTLRDNKREGANTFGAFVQNEMNIGDNLSIIIGGRYDNITYYSENFLDPSLGLQKKSFERFTPKAGLTYLFSKTHSIYANLGGGVEVPAGNETDPASTFGQDTVYNLNPLLEPISSNTFEIGTKHLMYQSNSDFIKSVMYDLAIYYIIINNDIIPYRGGRFYFTAGKTDRMGIETSLNVQFNNGFSVLGAFTFSQNKYKEYLVDSVHYGNPGAFADYKNNKVAGIPDLFYSAGLSYSPEFFSSMYANITLNGTGKYFVDDANKIEIPSYNIISATIGVRDFAKISDMFFISGFVTVNNLTDEKYAASAFINPDIVAGEAIYLEPGLPRNISASIILRLK